MKKSPETTESRSRRRASRAVRAALAALVLGATAAQAEKVKHDIVAADLEVLHLGEGNTPAEVSVTVKRPIGDFRIRDTANRGDYDAQIGEDPLDDVATGLLFTSISENGRDNLHSQYPGTNYATSHIEWQDTGSYFIPVAMTWPNSASTSVIEYNMNVSAAWFPYNTWLAGFAFNLTTNQSNGAITRANGGVNNTFVGHSSLVLGTHFVDLGGGRARVDLTSLGIDSRTDGVLLVIGAKNEDNYALSMVNQTNGVWELFSKDNGTDTTSLEHDPFAFVFVPKTNATVISGRFNGAGDILLHDGAAPRFTVAPLDTGRWELKMTGRSAHSGVLLLSPEGGLAQNFDNIVTYQTNNAGDGWIIESRDLPGVLPPLETPGTEPVASFVFIPAPSPGITVKSEQPAQTTEAGGAYAFTVELDTAPTSPVVLTLASSDETEGTLSLTTLTFTPEDWNMPQSVTVTGQDDADQDGAVAYRIDFTAASEDPAYEGVALAPVQVSNIDNEGGITVSPASGLATTEAGGTATFTVVLNTQPSANVVVPVVSATVAEASVAPAQLTFTPADWNVPQTVTVTGADDSVDDGDQPFTVKVGPATSTDLGYNGRAGGDVAGLNADDDTAGVVVEPITALSVVEGGTATFTVALRTAPTNDVVITSASSVPASGTVSPENLTFNAQNWSVAQTVTVTGVDNLVADGNRAFSILTTLASADTVYAPIDPVNVAVTVLDNEPAVVLPAVDVTFGLGGAAVGINGLATVTDLDSTDYNGGSLSVSVATNATASDRLEIRSGATASGVVTVTEGNVSVGGTAIGSFTGGTAGAPLVVSLNGSSSPAAVEAVLRAVTFRTEDSATALRPRALAVTLLDGDGGSATGTAFVKVAHYQVAQFQEGVDTGLGLYTGQDDIRLSEASPETAFPAGTAGDGLLIDWPDSGQPNTSQVLMRFKDLFGSGPGQIPAGATIVSAELLLTVRNPGDGGTFHRLLVDWDATNATWNSVGGGFFRDDVSARFDYDSAWGLVDGSGSSGSGTVSIGVTPDVQAWAAGEVNQGWVMMGWDFMTDGTGIAPGEAANPADRPRLKVVWLPATTASAASFRQGVNDYAGTKDTRLRQNAPDLDQSALDSLFLDAADAGGTNESQVLLRFEDIVGANAGQIPANVRVVAAFLDLASVTGDAMGHGGPFYPMVKDWSDTDTWNTLVNGVQADGAEAAPTFSMATGPASLTPHVQGGFNSFDVTADVQAWVAGTLANRGWAVLPWAEGRNGWGFSASEALEERDRPRLRVFYTTAPAPVSPATLGAITRTGSTVELVFNAAPSKTFSVERAPAVTGPWAPVGTVATDANGRAVFSDAASPADAGFYRVVAQ